MNGMSDLAATLVVILTAGLIAFARWSPRPARRRLDPEAMLAGHRVSSAASARSSVDQSD
jgi:hypothetical protein